jgi:hypothetical protein
MSLAVDHCHDTENVRGFLCSRCNKALGFMRDRPDLLRAAADYLETTREHALLIPLLGLSISTI